MIPSHIRGIVFDCDGTLADTMPLHWRAWKVISEKYQFHFPEDRFYSLGGVPSRHILQMISKEQGIPMDHMAVSKEKEEAYLPFLREVREIECVVSVAREAYGVIPMAVASGGTKHIIEEVLNHLGIRHFFNAVVTSEDVVHQKPAPDIFLEAAKRIGVNAASCRAYEDTDLGMQSIRAAGMEAIDVRPLIRATM
jgi:beta-phosphoglucomutase family hydrolase